MHFGHRILFAVVIALGRSTISASVSATFTPANMPSAQRVNAVADDSTGFLAANGGAPGFRSFDLSVVVPPNDVYSGTGLLVQLTQGQLFQAVFEQPDPSNPIPVPDTRVAQPFLMFVAPNRDLFADTFLTITPAGTFGFDAPIIAGRYIPAGVLGTEIFSTTELNIAYGVSPRGAGTFIIARITLSLDAVGTITGDLQGFGALFPFSFPIEAVPEPVGMTPIGTAALLLARRRRGAC